MMQIGERVSVTASFSAPYKIKPLRFCWSDRVFEVREITYMWRTKEGQRDIYHFSLSAGHTLYELTFDAVSLIWKLENLITEP